MGEVFKTVVEHTPLVSVDLIVKNRNKILLGKRINKPAQGILVYTWGKST